MYYGLIVNLLNFVEKRNYFIRELKNCLRSLIGLIIVSLIIS